MDQESDLASAKSQGRIWKTVSAALGAELREDRKIHGVSGLEHPVQAIAVDDKNSRVLVFSAEPNPRVAALMQVDVQSAMPDTRVLVARPIAFDLGVMARQIFKTVDDARININDLKRRLEKMEKKPASKKAKARTQKQIEVMLSSSFGVFQNVALPALSQLVDVLQQFSHLDWPSILKTLEANPADPFISFAALMEIDNLAIDREHGICPLPLYEFKESDWELMLSGQKLGDVQNRLRELDVYQYFFPPADHLALGAVEKGLRNSSDVVDLVGQAPKMGHPFSDAELLPSASDIPRILEDLAQQGYVAEGKYGVSLTSKGTTARAEIKFRPRESLLVKLMNRFTVKANLSVSAKDFLE